MALEIYPSGIRKPFPRMVKFPFPEVNSRRHVPSFLRIMMHVIKKKKTIRRGLVFLLWFRIPEKKILSDVL